MTTKTMDSESYLANVESVDIANSKAEYIPYSIRHNITDKDLAGLLDYLERDMGW